MRAFVGALATALIASVLIVALIACVPAREFLAGHNTGSPDFIEVAQRVPATAELVVIALIVALAFGIPLGRAARSSRWFGGPCYIVALLTAALPVFWFAVLLQAGNMVVLFPHSLPTAGIGTGDAFNLGDHIAHLIMPTIAFALPLIGMIALLFGGRIPAGGAGWPSISELWTTVARLAPVIISYDIIVEPVFAWPGIGRQFVDSATHLDFAVTIGLLAFGTLVVVACNIGVAVQPMTAFPAARLTLNRLSLQNPIAIVGAVVLIAVAVAVLVPALIAPIDPQNIDAGHWQGYALGPGTAGHLLGTDEIGRDLYARLVFGARTSVGIALFAALAALGVAVLLRTAGTRFGGWTPIIIARVVDAAWSIPPLALVMILVSIVAVRTSIQAVTVPVIAAAIFATLWAPVYRSIRARGLTAAHLPAAIAGALIIEVTISFLGFGVQPPAPSWGNMLANVQSNFFGAYWVAIAPALCIMVTVASLLALARWMNARPERAGMRLIEPTAGNAGRRVPE